MNDALVLILSSVTLAAPLVLAAMGGLLSERSGVVNIALEGMMLTAACVTALGTASTGSPVLGLLLGVAAAIFVGLGHALLTQAFGLDHIISGIGLNIVAAGGTEFLSEGVLKGMLDPTDPLPASLFWALALASVAAVALLLYRTRPGLHLKATGEDPDKARQMGLKPVAIRYAALAGCGVLTGLSGALIYSSAGQFSGGMTAGQGYIALAAVIIGRWMPLPTLIACWMFGLFLALQIQLQGSNVLGYEIPSQFWNMLPYLATVIALAGLLGRMRPPAGLGKA